MHNLKVFIILLISTGSCLVQCQFLQPQSHLGRLVQSITSPLVLGSSGAGDSGSGYGSEESPPYHLPGSPSDESSPSEASHGHSTSHERNPSHQRQQQQQQQQQQYYHNQQHLQHQGLQQAPSQQRGIPQDYYYRGGSSSQNQAEGEDSRDQVGSAPSNNKGTQEYQMGAYLGPTIDDKEINGVFNGKDDDRDSDEGPSGYEGPQIGSGASHNANRGESANFDGGYQPQGGYERQPSSHSNVGFNYARNNNPYDEDGADEDEGPSEGIRSGSARGQGGSNKYRGGGGLNQAASQYNQQQGGYGNSGMMAAANGYSPYGYNGPVDISGMMGGDPSQGFQVYNGDGSYPGQNYYNQQGNRQRNGGRSGYDQSASMNNNNGPYQNGNPQGGVNNGDNDEVENDNDDD